ncbi:hypothetical protein BaRGS_00017468 [Batillaria attramentaria]|uniref:Uncharacterized protein n=1 Tax=Batillaria attramentaria TaxID=370345 RepID=A0ABD0KVR5_9CAEN
MMPHTNQNHTAPPPPTSRLVSPWFHHQHTPAHQASQILCALKPTLAVCRLARTPQMVPISNSAGHYELAKITSETQPHSFATQVNCLTGRVEKQTEAHSLNISWCWGSFAGVSLLTKLWPRVRAEHLGTGTLHVVLDLEMYVWIREKVNYNQQHQADSHKRVEPRGQKKKEAEAFLPRSQNTLAPFTATLSAIPRSQTVAPVQRPGKNNNDTAAGPFPPGCTQVIYRPCRQLSTTTAFTLQTESVQSLTHHRLHSHHSDSVNPSQLPGWLASILSLTTTPRRPAPCTHSSLSTLCGPCPQATFCEQSGSLAPLSTVPLSCLLLRTHVLLLMQINLTRCAGSEVVSSRLPP